MGALKDHLVDPKALPGGPVDRLVGLVGPLVGPKALPADRVGHLGGLADLLVDPEVHPAKKKHRLDTRRFS